MRENIPLVTGGPARGLPPRIYLPIVVAVMLAFLGVVGYFLRIGLGVTGAALGPAVPVNADAGSGPNGVGGGTPAEVQAGGPPPMVQRLLVELRGRVARDPRDVRALAGLASLYVDAGKYDQANRYAAQALAVAPNDPEALFDVATIDQGQGHRPAAVAAYRRFLRVAPRDERAGQARAALQTLGASP